VGSEASVQKNAPVKIKEYISDSEIGRRSRCSSGKKKLKADRK
jgi:hypothetical protein